MSKRTLPIQQRQLLQQRRMLQTALEPSRDLPDRQDQAARVETLVEQQRHSSNQ